MSVLVAVGCVLSCLAFQLVNAALCPDGWQNNGTSCYYFSKDTKEWRQALAECKIQGGHLAEIEDSSEGEFLSNKVIELGSDYWIGGTDSLKEHEWLWVESRNNIEHQSYTHWPGNDPNTAVFSNGDEDCLEISHWFSGYWNDDNCDDHEYYICERSIDWFSALFG